MTQFQTVQEKLIQEPKVWLVTGVAGFIGSNLLEKLLKLNQRVVGLDNFSTGHKENLEEVKTLVSAEQWANFQFILGDICSIEDCRKAMNWGTQKSLKVNYILHQAALGSVPRSVEDPIKTNKNNIEGFLNILVAARDAKVKRVVYAASSSTYGDSQDLPKVEDKIGTPLSPYAVTKLVNELYAGIFSKIYHLESIGLRYFNIFGRRQDPAGAYAAVIPKWIGGVITGQKIYINGDGETSRDFCYIDNAVQANILAATTEHDGATNQIYNIAVGQQTSLKELYKIILQTLKMHTENIKYSNPEYLDFREGDVRHSLAAIEKAKSLLGYQPSHKVDDGIKEAMEWYLKYFKRKTLSPTNSTN